MHDKVILWSEDNRGIYIQKHFADSLNVDGFEIEGFDAEDWGIIESGPDTPDYWDAWNNVLQWTFTTRDTGQVYHLHQDGSLWFVDITAQAGIDHQLWI